MMRHFREPLCSDVFKRRRVHPENSNDGTFWGQTPKIYFKTSKFDKTKWNAKLYLHGKANEKNVRLRGKIRDVDDHNPLGRRYPTNLYRPWRYTVKEWWKKLRTRQNPWVETMAFSWRVGGGKFCLRFSIGCTFCPCGVPLFKLRDFTSGGKYGTRFL